MPSFNEHFIENMTGGTVKFDVQPYERGEGVIKSIKPRMVDTVDHCPRRGKMAVKYECYDLEVEVVEGSKTGALYGGVPVAGTTRDQAGKTTWIYGVGYGELRKAVKEGETIVQARCG